MEEELTLDLRDIFHIIRKRMKTIILITLACTLVSGLVSFYVLKPVYESSTSIIVGKPEGTSQTQTEYNDVMLYQKLIQTYQEIAKSRVVAEQAYTILEKKYTVGEIQGVVTVTPQADTQILVIKAKSGDPVEAAKICSAVSQAFIEQSKVVFPTGGDIQVMDTAMVPVSPVSPNKKMNLAIAFLIGLMGSMGLAFVMEMLDRTIKTEDDIERYLGVPVIGMIPREGTR
ncbi:MAG: putative capsular polysaccharide biosynthesis protein [Firmicutes bacterium]|nr:putative capsular polysaccharide biosynthesis protein [Bacillota bacterium]